MSLTLGLGSSLEIGPSSGSFGSEGKVFLLPAPLFPLDHLDVL